MRVVKVWNPFTWEEEEVKLHRLILRTTFFSGERVSPFYYNHGGNGEDGYRPLLASGVPAPRQAGQTQGINRRDALLFPRILFWGVGGLSKSDLRYLRKL